ncbi:MAG TPA: acyltransferase [Archaeoglobus profundus]|nr:acyltransferase [Archaeoglobus profundus]
MLEKLIIPPNTKFEERYLIVEGDAIIGPNSVVGYGVIARKVVIGERATIEGDILGKEEVRLGAWCNIKGNVISKGDAYIGEFVAIDGRLTVYGDLEIGRNVRIKRGFEARGLITIQDPMPILLFIFFYLLELLRLGKIEEAEKLFDEDFISPLTIPENSIIRIDMIKTDKDAFIQESRVLGNVNARNVTIVGSELYGSLRGNDLIIRRSRIHGIVEGKNVYLVDGSTILGNIKADKVFMEERCVVEGSIVGKSGVWIRPKVEIPSDKTHGQ